VPSRRLLVVSAALIALLFSACGGDDQRKGADVTTPPTTATTETTMHDMTTLAGGPSTTEANKTTLTIVAKNIAFEPKNISIAVNQAADVVLDNQDASVPHNLHFLTPDEVKTDTKNGPNKQTAHIKVDKAGTYKYLCDVHPTMTGELTVS
jgi:plastocyanin